MVHTIAIEYQIAKQWGEKVALKRAQPITCAENELQVDGTMLSLHVFLRRGPQRLHKRAVSHNSRCAHLLAFPLLLSSGLVRVLCLRELTHDLHGQEPVASKEGRRAHL